MILIDPSSFWANAHSKSLISPSTTVSGCSPSSTSALGEAARCCADALLLLLLLLLLAGAALLVLVLLLLPGMSS